MQWRFAITIVSGYFIYQLFTPVLFHYHGAIVAGRMGMTLAVVNTLSGISLAWVNARVPTFGALIARKDWKSLDSLFARALRQSLGVISAGACVGLGIVWVLQQFPSIGTRFLPASQVALLLAATVLNHVVNAFALYLRAHKREPLVWIAVGAAILVGLSTWLLGKYFSSLGVAAGNLGVYLFYSLPMVTWLWRKLRREWHRDFSMA